jgi:VanZ family protein
MRLSSPRTWIFILYLCTIVYLSATPSDQMGWFSSIWKYDKYVHFFEYLILGFLLVNALLENPMSRSDWISVIAFIIIFPIIDETVQRFTPGRIPDVMDGIADISGGLVGTYLRRLFP